MNTYVLYHGPYCRDGFGAAFAAWLKLGFGELDRLPGKSAVFKMQPINNLHPDEQYRWHPAHYISMGYDGDLPDIPDGSRVYMLDYSRSREEMDELAGRCDLTVLDHHASAQRRCEDAGYAIFDMDKSGAVLAWEHFHPNEPVPELLLYVQDRDLWRWELPGSREVSLAIQAMPMEFGDWQAIYNDSHGVNSLAHAGHAMMRYQRQLVDDVCKWARVENGMVQVNSSCLMSELGHELLDRFPEAQIAVIYWQRSDRKWQWSFRSRKDGPDVSKLAEQHGGGGHPNAAGCVSEKLGLAFWRDDEPPA